MRFPKQLRIGGQLLRVERVISLEGSKLGTCCLGSGEIKIAETFDGRKQSESCQINTLLHEMTHAILDTMGRVDLSADEVFVSSFAGFLTEAVVSISEHVKFQDIEG